VDELTNLLGDVKDTALKGNISRSYPTLIKTYLNVLIRTKSLRGGVGDFDLVKGEKPPAVIEKIENYIAYLADKGIYNLGKDEVIMWKIGNP